MGSYLDSCRGCHLEGDVLRCSHCELPCGRRVPSSAKLNECPSGSFSNSGGQIECNKEGAHVPKPPGSYLRSCVDCDVKDQILTCRKCETGGGDGRPSARTKSQVSIKMGGCSHFGNDDGALVCEVATSYDAPALLPDLANEETSEGVAETDSNAGNSRQANTASQTREEL